jgi:hypothetical protein
MFQKAVKIADIIGRPIGSNIFGSNFNSFNFFYVLIMIDLVVYFSVSFENIYAFRDDFVRQIYCVATLGMGFQGWVKLLTFIGNREKLLEIASMTENFHQSSAKVRKNSAEDDEKPTNLKTVTCSENGCFSVTISEVS